MKTKWIRAVPAVLLFGLAIACGSDQQQQQVQSYKDTKSIVLDVLKSEDAQKAIQEALNKNKDKTAQLLSTNEGVQMQMAVKQVLTDPSNAKFLEKTMTDPRFAGEFAKAIEKQNKQIYKDLLKDPTYQKSMMEAMNTPDFDQIMFTLMKQPKYKQMMMNAVTDSMQSPLFKLQVMDMMKKVVEEGVRPAEENAQGGGQKQQQQSQQQQQKQGGQGKEGGQSSSSPSPSQSPSPSDDSSGGKSDEAGNKKKKDDDQEE